MLCVVCRAADRNRRVGRGRIILAFKFGLVVFIYAEVYLPDTSLLSFCAVDPLSLNLKFVLG